MRQQLAWGIAGVLLCWAARWRGWNPRALARGMAGLLGCLILAQIGLALAGGASLLRNVLPLHLCSVTALLAVPMLWRWDERLFQFCWFLGMPGAFLALLFPVVGGSPWPALTRAVFLAVHALLVIGPIFMRRFGAAPRRNAAWLVLLAANLLLLTALAANRLLAANYLFLAQPPAGTPLAWMARHGQTGLIAWLETAALLLLRIMSRRAERGALAGPPR